MATPIHRKWRVCGAMIEPKREICPRCEGERMMPYEQRWIVRKVVSLLPKFPGAS